MLASRIKKYPLGNKDIPVLVGAVNGSAACILLIDSRVTQLIMVWVQGVFVNPNKGAIAAKTLAVARKLMRAIKKSRSARKTRSVFVLTANPVCCCCSALISSLA